MSSTLPTLSREEIQALPSDGGKNYNRLIFASSPYLLQHAENPVDWWEWSEAAFEKASEENKPVFLSVGYSTCHWCHVMAKESFEDPEVAHLLNQHFISIKVDREERPDLDKSFMDITQALSGHGGWPMTVIMTPHKQVFFAGTYLPKVPRKSNHGMMSLLPVIQNHWLNKREELTESGEKILRGMTDYNNQNFSDPQIKEGLHHLAFEQFKERFDENHGGFGEAPKFPTPHHLIFLMDYAALTGTAEAFLMARITIEKIIRSGCFDIVDGGFHRYSTDEKWLLPHFEKMLYDQAMMILALTRLKSYRNNEALYEIDEALNKTLAYLENRLGNPEGAYYSAEDADSEGEEGLFYTWTFDEINDILEGKPDKDYFISVFGLLEKGNYRDEATGLQSERNILHREVKTDQAVHEERIKPLLEKLAEKRENRVRPHLDDKILTDWNALLLAALSQCARLLNNQQAGKMADKLYSYFCDKLVTEGGMKGHSERLGRVEENCVLEDYAITAWALMEYATLRQKAQPFKQASNLLEIMETRFLDESRQGYFMSEKSESFPLRPKEYYDGAMPSGNSFAAAAWSLYAQLTAEPEAYQKSEAIVSSFSKHINTLPMNHSFLLNQRWAHEGKTIEIVAVGDSSKKEFSDQLTKLKASLTPLSLLIVKDSHRESEVDLHTVAPFVREMSTQGHDQAFYLCRQQRCEAPVFDLESLLNLMEAS